MDWAFILQILDKIGCVAAIIGSLLIAKLKKSGYAWFIVCNICFGIIGYHMKFWGEVVMYSVMSCIDLYCYCVWANKFDDNDVDK